MRSPVNISKRGEGDDEDELQELGSRKTPRTLSPMDKFASFIGLETCFSAGMTQRQQNISETLFKERTQSVCEYNVRWVYEPSIPFNAIMLENTNCLLRRLINLGRASNLPVNTS